MKIHEDLLQGSFDWEQLRLGKLSASRVSPLMAAKGLGKGARTLAITMIAEEMTGEPMDVPNTWAMERGVQLEPEARNIYKNHFPDKKIIEVGGIENDKLWYSPDGLVGADGLIEIKCPLAKQYIEILLSKTVLPEYKDQLQFGLMVSGRKWIDFVAFNPDFPADKAIKVIRVERDEKYIALMQERIEEFNVLINNLKSNLK